MRQLNRIVFTAAISLFLSTAGGSGTSRPVDLSTSELIVDNGTERFVFKVEVARTPAQKRQGLQGRRVMAADSGMLFPVVPPSRRYMWMDETYIPLDIIFIDGQGTIAEIFEQAEPLSRKQISSKSPVSAVLEITGGTSTRLGIKPGDRVTHPALRH
jgi:uncharacterized membrane protein (UPF0127 family)